MFKKICMLTMASLAAAWLTLATPSASQAQVAVTIGAGRGVYGGVYYRPNYYRRGYWGGPGYYGGYGYGRPVVVQPAPVVVAPPVAPVVVPQATPYVMPSRGYYAAPY